MAVYSFFSQFNYLDGVGDWGTIEDNYTGDGVLGAVVERRADIGVGAFYLWYSFISLVLGSLVFAPFNLSFKASRVSVPRFFHSHFT